MIFSVKYIFIGIVVLLALLVVYDGVRLYVLIKKSEALVKKSRAFDRVQQDADMKILVLGDSTAVGTGSEDPLLSTAGRLGSLYPKASIRNLAQNGLKLQGLLAVLDTLDQKEHFDVVLVQIGANDIIRLTSMDDIRRDAERVFARLSEQGDNVIILHSGNVADAPFFPFYAKPTLSKRSFALREVYVRLARKYGAHYVDLIDSPAASALTDAPHIYYAPDKLHLTGAGYGLWFSEIEKAL